MISKITFAPLVITFHNFLRFLILTFNSTFFLLNLDQLIFSCIMFTIYTS